MRLEFHQLERPWEPLRVREPQRQARLLASLAEQGQQNPIVVVAAAGSAGRYIVIDGYARIQALQQLQRDTVEATVWEMSEAEAVVLAQTLRCGGPDTALEQGWLLAELQRRFGYSLEELAQRFDRSASWASRRLALAEVLPHSTQQHIRQGRIAAQTAMKLSGAGGADQPAGVRTARRGLRGVPLRHSPSRAPLHGLEERIAHATRAHSLLTGPVSENTAACRAASGTDSGRGTTARRGHGRGDPRTRATETERGVAGDGRLATRDLGATDRRHQPDDRAVEATNAASNQTC